MNNINDIMKNWEIDSVVDRTDPGSELLKIPQLHSKYLDALIRFKRASKKIDFKLIKMKKLKNEYYSGKISDEDLKENNWEPFQLKILKTDINTYVDSDPDIINLLAHKFEFDECVSAIELIMNELKSRTFQLRDFIAWEKFVGGQ